MGSVGENTGEEKAEAETETNIEVSSETKTTSKKKRLSKKKRDAMIVDHREHGKRLAWSFLSSWRIRMNQDEVMSVVGAALCEAGIRFDPTKGVAFKTFFYYHLRGMLLKEISKMIQEQKVLQFMPNSVVSESIKPDQVVTGWSLPLIENNNPERIIEKRQVASACWEACAQLDPLEQEVLIRYFVYDEPLVSIAEELDYCRCHISRVKSRALKKMGGILNEALEEERELVGAPSEEEEIDLDLPNRSTVESRRRKSYTGGRGRRKQKEAPKKSKALEKILAQAY